MRAHALFHNDLCTLQGMGIDMKTILIYFSLGGNTDYTAKRITAQTGAELLRLETIKNYPKAKAIRMFWCGRSAVFGEKPRLKPYKFSSADYDLVILGSPVWAGRYTPPMHTFLNANDLSGCTVAYFSCHAGDYPEKFYESMRTTLKNCPIAAEADFIDPNTRHCDETDAQIDAFCRKIRAIQNNG